VQPGIWQILIIAVVVLILFGRGRISEMMGDFGKGIKSFRKGMTDEEEAKKSSPAQISADNAKSSETAETAPADKTNS